MKAIDAIVAKMQAKDTRLGNPSESYEHHLRRMTMMENLACGKGFRVPAKAPKKNADGTTRGDRKRALRAASNAKVSEHRAPEFMHSAARRLLTA